MKHTVMVALLFGLGACFPEFGDYFPAGNGGAGGDDPPDGGTGTGGNPLTTTTSTMGDGGTSSAGGAPVGGTGGMGGVGGDPVGGDGGMGGVGGGPPATVMVECGPLSDPFMVEIPETSLFVCWYLDPFKHPSSSTLALGGTVDQPSGADTVANPFLGCVTTATTDNDVLCDLGPREIGTDLILKPTAHQGPTTFQMCDVPGLPTSKCQGEYRVYNGPTLLGTFVDPPSGPWSYGQENGFLTLNFTVSP
jgi:hypothetical protein